MSSVCIAPVFVPNVKASEWADVPKIQLGEQRVDTFTYSNCTALCYKHSIQTLVLDVYNGT